MSELIKVTPEELKRQALMLSQLESQYKDLFSNVSSELSDMNENWSSLLANNFVGKINSAQKGFSNIEKMLASGANAAREAANGFETIDSALARSMGAEGNKNTKKSEKKEKNAPLNPIAAQRKVNEWIDKLPKSVRNTAKAFYKNTIGKKLKGVDDAYKIWADIADEKYGKAFSGFVKLAGGDGFKIIMEKGGLAKFGWAGVAVEAGLKAIELAVDSGGYVQKNTKKYWKEMDQAFQNGDLAGLISSRIASDVQVGGKMVVDVACQTVNAVLDSVVSYGTGGWFTLSSMNDFLYDVTGNSPGHMFNVVTKSISDTVDTIVDKDLKIVAASLVNTVGDVASTSIHNIGSILKK